VKNYYFIEDYINPEATPGEMTLLWLFCVALLIGLPYFSAKVEKLLDKQKKD